MTRHDYAPKDTTHRISAWSVCGHGLMLVAAIAPLSYVMAYVIVWAFR